MYPELAVENEVVVDQSQDDNHGEEGAACEGHEAERPF
jgi:hypothetical protein